MDEFLEMVGETLDEYAALSNVIVISMALFGSGDPLLKVRVEEAAAMAVRIATALVIFSNEGEDLAREFWSDTDALG